MKNQLSALVLLMISIIFSNMSYSYDYGNDTEILKEQFKTPFVPNQQEVDFRAAWLKTIDDGLQKRDPEKIRWNNFLSHLARKRAEDYVRYRDQWDGHVDQLGKYVQDWSYPVGYDQGVTESLVRYAYNENSALEALIESPNHRPHLLGEGYNENDVFYGIGVAGFAENTPIYIFVTSNESTTVTEVVETDLKPTVRRFEDRLRIDLEYGYKFLIYEVKNLDPGKYTVEFSEDLLSWRDCDNLTVYKNDDRWHETAFVTEDKSQVYLRIVKVPTETSVETTSQ